jgi:hypothetical protein
MTPIMGTAACPSRLPAVRRLSWLVSQAEGLSHEEALNAILALFCELCALFYADIYRALGLAHDTTGETMDIPGLVRHQIHWLKRACQNRQQQPALPYNPAKGPAPSQAHPPAPVVLQYTQALRGLLKDASAAHQLHRAACVSIVRALLADILASVLCTTLGYTVADAAQAVDAHITPVLTTYLTHHGPRLARAHGHGPSA